jgi:SAM-dependent methyltransferase
VHWFFSVLIIKPQNKVIIACFFRAFSLNGSLMRTERIVKSSKELDAVENDWWNRNSATVEKIWAHTYPLQQAIRLPYMKRAKEFLKNKNGKTVIWEVGCGTGWVCRLIAGEDFHIHGTDFSQAQIDTAKALAKKFNKDAYCRYEVTDASTLVQGHNGIVISALLHHLTETELEGFFKVMDVQPKGTRVFLYEPVFIKHTEGGSAGAAIWKGLSKIFRKISLLLIKATGKRNDKLIADSDALFHQADRENWFLSPKEVPFYEDEINKYFDRYFTVRNQYFVNDADFELAQHLMYYGHENPGFFFTGIILPIATWMDRVFFSTNFRSVSKGRYFFCCYECVVK